MARNFRTILIVRIISFFFFGFIILTARSQKKRGTSEIRYGSDAQA